MRRVPAISCAAPLACLVLACGGGGADAGDELSVRFGAVVAGEPFACGETYVLPEGATYAPSDLRFYVHDLRLLTADDAEVPLRLAPDGKWQTEVVVLLDFEDRTGGCDNGTPDVRDRVVGRALAGDYVGLRFRVGVPFAENHSDAATAESPLSVSALFWSWQAGRKFLRADGEAAVGDGDPAPVLVHLGSTGCSGVAEAGGVTACARPNRPEVTLRDFDPTAGRVVLDVAALLAGVPLGADADAGGDPGCMSAPDDPECDAVFENLGLDAETGQPTGAQTAFAAEP